MNTLEIQTRLKQLGFDPGALDGIPGRNTTAAVLAFQRANGLADDGVAGPATLQALFPDRPRQRLATAGIPWLELAHRKLGLHEGRDNAALREFLVSDRHTLGDPAELPWCGDFVETCIAVTLPREPLPANPYLARNWLKFGKAVEPTLGAIAVYWRGSPQGIQGHVAFLVGRGTDGQGRGVFYNLGGNQSNSVSVSAIDSARLLECRWPLSVASGTIELAAMAGGRLTVNEA